MVVLDAVHVKAFIWATVFGGNVGGEVIFFKVEELLNSFIINHCQWCSFIKSVITL